VTDSDGGIDDELGIRHERAHQFDAVRVFDLRLAQAGKILKEAVSRQRSAVSLLLKVDG
jgi:hypothetical protein